MANMLKVPPIADYPAEEGCFLRGNDCSPVAVVVLQDASYAALPPKMEHVPPEIQNLVKAAIETGAALSGTLQTENIGIEKIVCNIVGNPNIRYLVLCGEEVAGHQAGSAVKALLTNGINQRRTIIGSRAVTPYLFNIPLEAIDQFRKQLTLVDLIGEMDPQVIVKAVWSCYQEKPTVFKEYMLQDPGAFCETGIATRLTGKVAHPEAVEEWELDDVIKRIEAEAEVKIALEGKEVAVEMSESKFAAIGSHLSRIAEELSQIAKILLGEAEPKPIAAKEAPVVEEAKPVCAASEEAPTVVAPVVAELTKEELYFHNQLRAYPGILAGLSACDKDICHIGLSLPVAVNSIMKKLGKLRKSLEESSVSEQRRAEFLAKIDSFLEVAQLLPTEPGPCQKTVGNCTIGSGCLASGAADLLKQVTEPASLTQ